MSTRKDKPNPLSGKQPAGESFEFTPGGVRKLGSNEIVLAGKSPKAGQPPRRRFLHSRDRDDVVWFFDDAEAELADVRSPSDPDLFKVRYSEPRRSGQTVEFDRELEAAKQDALPLRIRRKVRSVARFRKVRAALRLMHERGLGSWVEILQAAYKRQDFVIEDGGDYRRLRAGEDERNLDIANFGGLKLVRTRKERGAARRTNGAREELLLSNGQVMLKGGHIVGSERAVASVDVPGLARLAHPIARRNLEEALEHACRGYEAARAATDSKYRSPKPPKVETITQAEAAERMGCTRAAIQKKMRRGVFRLIGTRPPYKLEWPPLLKEGAARQRRSNRARSSAL